MTYDESQQLIRRKKREERDFGLVLIFASLCVAAIIAYGLH
jgi:hypothetical protein